ncbi:MAG: hypothetical protein Q8N58_01930 [bacterium]|nr:hypothetical protein [bacterium]
MMTSKIEAVKTFGQLYDFIRGEKRIQGTKIIYLAGDLLDLIEDIRTAIEEQKISAVTKPEMRAFIKKNNPLFEKITRAQGIRKKVIELSIREAIAMSRGQ